MRILRPYPFTREDEQTALAAVRSGKVTPEQADICGRQFFVMAGRACLPETEAEIRRTLKTLTSEAI